MRDVFSITLPIFLIIGLGYLAIQLRWFAKPEVKSLGTFVLMLALPALIIRSFTQRAPTEVLDANYLLAYGGGSLAALLLGLAIMRWGLKKPMSLSAISAMGMSASNSGFIGYPLAALVVGPVAGMALALNMLVENVLIIPLALALADSGSGQAQALWTRVRMVLGNLARSPLIVAVLIGMGISLSGWSLPLPVQRTVDLLALASGPVALFVIGATLHGLRSGGMAGQLAVILGGKLLLHPGLVALGLLLFPVQNPGLQTAAVLTAAVPMLGIFPLLGQRFGHDKLCASALLGATLCSFASLTGLLLWLR